MDQFFGNPACWQLRAGIRLRSGETHVSQCHSPLLPAPNGKGEHCFGIESIVFTVESFCFVSFVFVKNEINLTLLQEKSQMWSPTGISNRG